jgi:hypothetical protein
MQRPIIVRNPVRDEVFDAALGELAAESVSTVEDFRRRLRERYPLAEVRPRDLAGERLVVRGRMAVSLIEDVPQPHGRIVATKEVGSHPPSL